MDEAISLSMSSTLATAPSGLLPTLVSLLATLYSSPDFYFLFLFVWRYLRLLVHIISFAYYRPVPTPLHPTVRRSDVTVIIPISDPNPFDPKFVECLLTVLANNPAAVIVTTVGRDNLDLCRKICAPINAEHGDKIRVIQQCKGNKRVQVCHAMPYVKTSIVIGVDSTVFWPSTNFLPAILAPFEDPDVGVVGTYKRVVREPTGFNFKSFWNFIGCLYLERHNFEVAATSNIDGGVFVISGRTAAYRTEIFADPAFQEGFQNERFFFGMFGPLNPDDDNFITRWVVRDGWKVKFQYSDDAMIQTRVGTYPRYLSQCLRWVRTTWRSNTASLFTDPFRTNIVNWVYLSQPWCVYAVYLTSFTNFALFTDLGLMYLVSTTSFASTYGLSFVLWCMAGWIFASKLVKPFPHFVRNPVDIIFLPGYFLFGYYHSLLKLYAMFTFWNCAWSGRVVEDANETSDTSDDEDTDEYSSEYLPLPPRTANGFNFCGRSPRNSDLAGGNVGAGPTGIASATGVTQTPWGAVKTKTPQTTPANVLQPQIPGFLPRLRGGAGPARSMKSKSAANTGDSSGYIGKSRLAPSLYDWTRGTCERLHGEEHNLLEQVYVLGTPNAGYSGKSRVY
jgi:cellulose synthase/poly-beta-1,6-N-acetylglucosamine synthase-like glycosyltransferase